MRPTSSARAPCMETFMSISALFSSVRVTGIGTADPIIDEETGKDKPMQRSYVLSSAKLAKQLDSLLLKTIIIMGLVYEP